MFFDPRKLEKYLIMEGENALDDVQTFDTKVEEVTERHKTPWITQWTMYIVEISEDRVGKDYSKGKHQLVSWCIF